MQKLSSATYEINYHIVWCTKYRKPYLKNIEKGVKDILETICQTKGWIIKELRVMPEHIHLFISTPPYESPTGIVKVLKGTSAIRIFKQYPEARKQFRKGHIWSPSYYVGTAGHVSAEIIERYIQGQSLNSSSQRVRRSP
ncbi:MAG: IS200/IS605 family transposase [Candidatus Aenigmarchaeota archaeon]|nr:IS200/IS605 family transposase [Candidatus Aenigmarchaeota archaeon]